MSFLLSLVAMMTVMNTEIRWKNDVLYMSLNDNVDDYRFLPEASLWINGIKVDDPLMYYERNGVERTFISTVNTAVVRSYTIKYRVHFPTFNISSTKSIIFQVDDHIYPTITKTPYFRIPLGSKMPDLKEGLVYSDNYDAVEKLVLSIQSSEVLLNRVGLYPVRYQVTDVSGNMSVTFGYIEVYDHLAPEITIKKALILSFGETFRYTDYFTIKDNYDLVLDIELNDQAVNYQKLGSYPMSLKATDQSGLSTTINEVLTIIDTKPPIIIFKSQPKIIPVHQIYEREELIDYVLSVRDDVDFIDFSDIEVMHDIDFNAIGTYAVYYTVSDQSNNVTSLKLNVYVKDIEPPKMTFTAPLIFDVFSVEPHLLSMIEVTDNHASVSSVVLKVTGTFKMHVTGLYPVTFTATDPSGNTETIRTYVEIIDRIAPIVIQNNDIVITDFARKSLVHFFTFSDQYNESSELLTWIEDQDVDYQTIGEYTFYACAKDTSGNINCLETYLIVADIEEPILMLKTNVVLVELNQEPLNLISFIESVSDNYDIVDNSMVLIHSNIDYQTPGRYVVTYTAFDHSFNQRNEILTVIVDDLTPPIITTHSIEIMQHQHFDPLQGVEAFDQEGSITILISPEQIDTSIPGTYVLVYTAIDERGNYTITERLVTVIEVAQSYSVQSFIPLMVLTTLGVASLYLVYRKMS